MNKSHWTLLHLICRLAGLTGLAVGVVGLVLRQEYDAEIGTMVALVGGGLLAIPLLVEIVLICRTALSARGAMGGNVALQVVLAMALLVGINVFSFNNYERFDWTQNREFTLDPHLRDEVAKLTADTTIVVVQRHAAFGQQSRQDNYDAAADRKIKEKIQDLVEQFQQIGARFSVQFLDIDDEKYEDHLASLRKLSPALAAAIDFTPENSVFFLSQQDRRITFLLPEKDAEKIKDESIDAALKETKTFDVGDVENPNADFPVPRREYLRFALEIRNEQDGNVLFSMLPVPVRTLPAKVRLSGIQRKGPILRLRDYEGHMTKWIPYEGILKDAEQIQRISFTDIYQLDREASQQANHKRGNLVLKYQGAGPFARKILNIEEKRPRIAVAAAADSDTMASPPPWGMGGAKKTLTTYGFDTRDLIMKTGAVLTYEESRFEVVDNQINSLGKHIDYLGEVLASREDFQKAAEKIKKSVTDPSAIEMAVKEINAKYGLIIKLAKTRAGIRQVIDVRLRKNLDSPAGVRNLNALQVLDQAEFLDESRERIELERERSIERRAALSREHATLNVEDLAEKRRIADVKTKVDRMLADCDLIIVPRWTLINTARGQNYPYSTYTLDKAHVEGIKAFLKAGKPVLFCFSPPNDEEDGANDGLDKIVTELGVRLGRDTVFFEVDSDAMEEARTNPAARGEKEVPPVLVDWTKGKGLLASQRDYATGMVHPLRSSLRLGARVSDKQPFDLHLRHPRPVYPVKYVANAPLIVATVVGLGASGTLLPLARAYKSVERLDDKAIFLMSPEDSWNEDNPVPAGDEPVPRFKPLSNDPNKGTIKEKRRGPFPIAVAIETKLPESWYDSKSTPRPTVRFAVIGHGGVFVGESLNAAKERLLLSTCNWLLGRNDLIAQEKDSWQFPRISLDEHQQNQWTWATMLGLPGLFAFFGLAMVLVRRMR
jgi:hypothetical protein